MAKKGSKSIPAKASAASTKRTKTKPAKAGTTKVTRPKGSPSPVKHAGKMQAKDSTAKANKGLDRTKEAKKLASNGKASDKVKEAPELEEQELSSPKPPDIDMENQEAPDDGSDGDVNDEADEIMGDDDGIGDDNGLDDDDMDDMD